MPDPASSHSIESLENWVCMEQLHFSEKAQEVRVKNRSWQNEHQLYELLGKQLQARNSLRNSVAQKIMPSKLC